MADPVLGGGVRVKLSNPAPTIRMAPPTGPRLVVLPIAGPTGPIGPAGGASAGIEHTQTAPSASWVIAVPAAFERRPGVAVYVAGEQVEADVTADSSTVSIQFPTPTSGSAVLT